MDSEIRCISTKQIWIKSGSIIYLLISAHEIRDESVMPKLSQFVWYWTTRLTSYYTRKDSKSRGTKRRMPRCCTYLPTRMSCLIFIYFSSVATPRIIFVRYFYVLLCVFRRWAMLFAYQTTVADGQVTEMRLQKWTCRADTWVSQRGCDKNVFVEWLW